MARVIVTHLTGSKSPSNETFELAAGASIRVGRDPYCELRYDAVRDDLVGRLHARIESGAHGVAPLLIDCRSRNGTFLNHRLVGAPAVLASGDVIQFGAGGPVVRIEVRP